MLRLNEKTWTRGASARDKDGKIVPPSSEKAVRWDIYSALRKSSFDYEHFWFEIVRMKLLIKSLFNFEGPVWIFNDRAEWQDVEKLMRKFNGAT
jgi:hypothetical protein